MRLPTAVNERGMAAEEAENAVRDPEEVPPRNETDFLYFKLFSSFYCTFLLMLMMLMLIMIAIEIMREIEYDDESALALQTSILPYINIHLSIILRVIRYFPFYYIRTFYFL